MRRKFDRIVDLVGSMRKGGNTDLLAQAFTEGASENNSVEIVSVADYKVNPCIGCNSCFAREGNKCFQKDDMVQIYNKLRAADMAVIASPVYFFRLNLFNWKGGMLCHLFYQFQGMCFGKKTETLC